MSKRAPRLEIYRPLTHPDGDISEILETQLNALEVFEPSDVHKVLSPSFKPRANLLGFREVNRMFNSANKKITINDLEELAAYIEADVSDTAQQPIQDVPLYPHSVHLYSAKTMRKPLSVAGHQQLTSERMIVKSAARAHMERATGIELAASVWRADREAARVVTARSTNEKTAAIIDRLDTLMTAAALVVDPLVTLEPIVFEVTT